MDDADLEKLKVKPGKLKPKFQRGVTEYEIVLNSGIKDLTVDPLTRDCNATWCIVGKGNERTITITEGSVFDLVIEVTAENGNTKNYIIKVTSLSSSSIYISTLKVDQYSLVPAFKNNVMNYECQIPVCCDYITVNASSPDSKTKIDIPNSENNQIKTLFGITKVEIHVTSPDGTKSVTYTINIQKDRLNFPFTAPEEKHLKSQECAICLSVPHCPVSIANDPSKFIFCKSCLQTVTRSNKKHPVIDSLLGPDFCVEEMEVGRLVSDRTINCQLKCGVDVCLGSYAKHLKEDCKNKLRLDEKSGLVFVGENTIECSNCPSCSLVVLKGEMEFHDKFICSSKHKHDLNHKREYRTWQKKYLTECGNVEGLDVTQAARKELEEYRSLLKLDMTKESSIMKMSKLERACQLYSNLIGENDKNHELHFKLGLVLEEMYYAEHVYGVKKGKSKQCNDQAGDTDNGEFQTEESMEDDIRALTKMRGYSDHVSTTNQLKALDEEYHALLDQNKSDKADYVQKLYAFKQKQQHRETTNKTTKTISEEDSFLHRALTKYTDAASVKSHFLYYMHMGRINLILRKFDLAVQYLRHSLSLKATNVEAKFYLAIAMISFGTYKSYDKTVKEFLNQGFLYHLHNELNPRDLESLAEDFNGAHNTLLLEGLFMLRERTQQQDKPFWDNETILLYISSRCFNLSSQLLFRGDVFQKYQLFALKSQYLFGCEKRERQDGKVKLVNFWKRLSGISKCIASRKEVENLCIQRKIYEAYLLQCPCSSDALGSLGDIYVSIMDVQPSAVCAKDIESLYRASIEVEGINLYTDEPPQYLKNSNVWKKLTHGILAAGDSKTKSEDINKGNNAKNTKAEPVKKRSTTKAEVASTSKAKPTTAKQVTPKTKPIPQKKLGVTPKAGTAAKTQTVSDSRAKKDKKPTTITTKSTSKEKEINNNTPAKISKSDVEKLTAKTSEIELNEKSWSNRLGLARILKGLGGETTEIESLYLEVINSWPNIHDAYIELGERVVYSKPLEAVDIYAKFPFTEDTSFDDGFLCGEIVRILMKEEKYEDPRLKEFMIRLGKVLGFSSLEKYVTALENKFKYNKLLREVYAGVNGKSVDDENLKAFFKFKCWE